MKAIMDQYGPAILTAIVVVAIFGIIFTIPDGKGNIGILEIMAANSDMDNSMYESMTDTKAVVDENSAILAPKLKCSINNAATLTSWSTYKPSVFLGVQIAGERTYPLSKDDSDIYTYEIENIILKSEDGDVNVTGFYNKNMDMFRFLKPGIYEITIRCYDLVNGKESTTIITVPVDKGR